MENLMSVLHTYLHNYSIEEIFTRTKSFYNTKYNTKKGWRQDGKDMTEVATGFQPPRFSATLSPSSLTGFLTAYSPTQITASCPSYSIPFQAADFVL